MRTTRGLAVSLVMAASIIGAPARAGETVELTGVLDVVIEDDTLAGTATTIHRLRDPETGEVRVLELGAEPRPGLVSGDRVAVTGVGRNGAFELGESGTLEVLETASLPTGDRSSVLLLVDFADAAVACSDSLVTTLMFDGSYSVDGLYRDSSFGTMGFPRDTNGDGAADVYRISIDASLSDACAPDAWAAAADVAAQNAGVDLAPYQHVVYVLPNSSCSWTGRANMGCGDSCRTWIDICNLPDVYAHELGHNLTLRHASEDMNNDDQPESSLGDISDFMGLSGCGWRQINGPHKLQMGWVPPSQVVQLGAGTHTVVLSPLEVDPADASYPQLLRIPRVTMGDDVYVSYRRKLGYDTGLRPEYADKANIQSHDNVESSTLFLGALGDGLQFDDPSTGASVLQVSHDSMSVTLQVTIPEGGCSADADGDGICDLDDICPLDATNDADADGICMPDDCDGTNPDVHAAPVLVDGVAAQRIATGARFTWADQTATTGPGTVYDVVTGSLAQMRSDGGTIGAYCAANDLATPGYDSGGPNPPVGQAFYFLVRGQNTCSSGSGGYGPDRATGSASCG